MEFENCIVKNVDMSSLTSFKIGGSALVIEPKDTEALRKALKKLYLANEKFYVLGNGTNILAADSALSRPVIKLGREMSEIEVNGKRLTVGAGALLSQAASAALANSLTGLEFAHGIPGSVGGGVRMNAGAYGGELSDIVEKVEFVTKDGELCEILGKEAQFSYRHSVFAENEGIITKVTFLLEKGNSAEIADKMKLLSEKRREKQPLSYPSAGSTFKRPEGNFAGALIEEAGLKGRSVGGAAVSEMHAGFVINTGGATARDVTELMEEVKRAVFEKSGVLLEAEVEIWK